MISHVLEQHLQSSLFIRPYPIQHSVFHISNVARVGIDCSFLSYKSNPVSCGSISFLSKPRLHLICNHKYFVVFSVQPNDGRMLNNSSRSLPLLKNKLKRMLIVFLLSIGSKTFRFVGRRDENQALGHAYMYLYIMRSVYKHIYVFCM